MLQRQWVSVAVLILFFAGLYSPYTVCFLVPLSPDFEKSVLLHPVFQHQVRHPLKFSCIIRHQYRPGGDGVPGNRRVVRSDRRPGQPQCHFNLRGGVYCGAIPGQDGIEAGQNSSTSWT